MQLKAKQNFSWAHRGVQVEHFEAGQIIETEDEELIEVSTSEGWTEEVDSDGAPAAGGKPSKKAHKGAPENKNDE